MYEDVILLTLQLLYYRSWVSRIKYTHVKAGKWNTRDMEHTDSHGTPGNGTYGQPWNTRTAMEHTEMEHTDSLLSVLIVVTHTHPTIPSMFIPPQRLIRPPGCIYAHEFYCMDGSTHDESQ